MLWLQGEDQAPELVRSCIASWRRLNPGWQLIVLDAETYGSYVDVGVEAESFSRLGLAMQSDLIRLALLEAYGGVWADSTVICVQPLDAYVDSYVASSGLFLFSRFKGDRIVSSWFLAATPSHPMVRRWQAAIVGYLRLYPPRSQYLKRQIVCHKICREALRISPLATRLWLHPWVIRLTGKYPYFLMHYIFMDLACREREFAELWRMTPRIFNPSRKAISRLLSRAGCLDCCLIKNWLGERVYMVKLSHKDDLLLDHATRSWLDCVL